MAAKPAPQHKSGSAASEPANARAHKSAARPVGERRQAVTVERGTSSGGFVVYGSPATPRHTTVSQIVEAVLALKAQ